MFIWKSRYKTLFLVVVIMLLFAPVHTDSLWWREALNSGHTVLFVFLSFVIYSSLKKARPTDLNVLTLYFYVLVIGLSFGGAVELLQTFVQREASLNDVYRNFFGLMAGLCLLAAFTFKNTRRHKILVVVLAVSGASFLLAGVSPLIRLSWHYLERASAFPVIMDFDSNWSRSFMHHNEGTYPGVSIIEPESDWSGYRKLNFSVHSGSQTDITLTLRVHDKTHNQDYSDRFNTKLLVRPGSNKVEIPMDVIRQAPLDRSLDLSGVAGVIIFSSNAKEWERVEVGNLFLE